MKNKIDRLKRTLRLKLHLLRFMLITLMLVLCIRVAYIKYYHGEEYERIAIEQQVTQGVDVATKANRGSIFDRNMQSLAASNTVYNVILDVRVLSMQSQAAQQKTFGVLNKHLDIPLKKLSGYLLYDSNKKLVHDTNYLVIAKNISRKKMSDVSREKISGVYFEEDTMRYYAHNNLAAQVIGFIRGDTSCGLENKYNAYLIGKPGRIFRMYDAQNNVIEKNIPAQDGLSLVTTIDINIQKFAEDAINSASEKCNAEHGSVIVMNPNTGEILAMAQYPSVDLNNPTELSSLSSERLRVKWQGLSQDEQLKQLYAVWNNFNITGTFESGSIFKPMVVSSALDENVIMPNSTFYCGGHIDVADRTIRCWKHSGHGMQDVTHVLANSCNVGLIQIIQKLGASKFFDYQKKFGYGEKTGIDLPAELSAKSLVYSLQQLNPVELATSSMGQGFNNTPIQALNSFASVINGGKLMKPFIVSQVIDSNGNVIKKFEPTILRKTISSETSEFIRKALATVVTEGTGKAGVIEGYNIGGKTGTGEQGRRGSGVYTYSFVGYLTMENPEYIAIGILDKPSISETPSAVPIVKDVFEKIIQYKQIKSNDNQTLFKEAFLLEDYKSKSLKETIAALNQQGLEYEVVGSGGKVVDSQSPIAGTPVELNSKIFLYASKPTDDLVIVPDVTGLTQAQAIELLAKSNFVAVVPDDNGEKKITQQMPSAGVKLESNSQIKLK